MNSVALPASASGSTSTGEADLVRQAARGDSAALEELYRRHSQPAWRLAQAVAPDRDAAVASFTEGFGRAVRAQRHARRDEGRNAFRPLVLASVYREAVGHTFDRAKAPGGPTATSAEEALAAAAFRSLPERWRAAVWLNEVENFDPARIAAVLGVSAAVATQLVARGRRGLAGRFSQAHQEVPEHFGTVLRSVGLAMPANLADATRESWTAARSEHAPLLAPATAWLEDKALRPMSVAVGALVGLGLIGLGVIPQGSPVRGSLGSNGNGSLAGSVPVRTCFGLPCSGPTGTPADNGAPGSFSSVAYGTSGGLRGGGFGYTATSGYGYSQPGTSTLGGPGALGANGGTPTSTGGSQTPPPGTSGSQPATGGGGGGGGGQTTPGGGGSGSGGGGGGTVPGGGLNLNLAPVATASTSGSSAGATLLPGSGAAVSASLGTGSPSVKVSVGGNTVLATPTTTTTLAPTTTTTAPPLATTVTSLVGGVENTVSGLTGGGL